MTLFKYKAKKKNGALNTENFNYLIYLLTGLRCIISHQQNNSGSSSYLSTA